MRSPEYVEHLRARGFELQDELGKGLSGAVFKATQTSLTRPVAVKFCDSAAARQNPQLRKRFEREGKLLARLSHPAIPYVLVTGVVPGVDVPYTVMEFIDGRRLREEMTTGRPLANHIAIQIELELLDALAAVHRANIVHRDVAPENLMISGERCMLIDFSIGFERTGGAGVTRATGTGEHLGRIEYMPPEQATNMGEVDQRCDIYSAGVVLLEMLTGSPKQPAHERLDFHLSDLAPGLRDVLKKALDPIADARFATALEFRKALLPFGTGGAQTVNVPVTAICASPVCPGADWTYKGYYRRPRIQKESTDSFCSSCGKPLKRSCEGCGEPFRDMPHCGRCGAEWYSIPECQSCGSWLMRADMGTDTASKCCSRGRRRGASPAESPSPPADGDIPF